VFQAWLDGIERNVRGINPGVCLEDLEMGGMLPDEARAVVDELALRYMKLPREPYLDKATGTIFAEIDGIDIDVETTLEELFKAEPYTNVQLRKTLIPSQRRGQDLQSARNRIGSYSTWFHGSPARSQNVAMALKSINNSVLWPGAVFSFNQTAGPRTPERGYMPAPIILNGGYEVGFGGGVCQVASTLYNAVLQAGLPVLERHGHTKPVGYVPEGRDAAVDYGYLDLKFQNNRPGPLILKTSYQGGKLYIEIRGEQ
jgi:vancomycin resistance protein YoaR